MMMSREALLKEARENYYKPEILEKVHLLMKTLDQFMSIPYLRERLVLKGGTALNLFHFNEVPRLSVDIDLNYIGQLDRELMIQERSIINDAIQQIFQQNQFELDRHPSHHAGGKMVWRYPSLLGQKGNLEIDLNYMYRQPLFPIQWLLPKITPVKMNAIPVLDIHELAAGKLSALFSRGASRDVFDVHYLLVNCKLDIKKLRVAFVAYFSMTAIELDSLQQQYINYNVLDMRNRLLPVLRQKNLPRTKDNLKTWAMEMINELRDALSAIIPLNNSEIDFITRVRNHSEIKPALLTDDWQVVQVIQSHPAIQWAATRER